MGSFNKLTLYDFMTMLIIGALIVAPFSTVDGFVCTMVFLIISYVIGLCYHKILDWLQSLLKLRNNECMIRKAFEVVCKEFPSASSLSNDINAIKESYYREYYRLMLKGCLANIPVLEAHVAFIRNLIPVIIWYIVSLACDCCKVSEMIAGIFGNNARCTTVIVLIVILVMLPLLWCCTQKKIHRLVWEGGYFISSICSPQNQQRQPQQGQSVPERLKP